MNTNPGPNKVLYLSHHNVTFPAILHHYVASNGAVQSTHLLLWRLLEMNDCQHFALLILIRKTGEVHMFCVTWINPSSLLTSCQLALMFTPAVTWC